MGITWSKAIPPLSKVEGGADTPKPLHKTIQTQRVAPKRVHEHVKPTAQPRGLPGDPRVCNGKPDDIESLRNWRTETTWSRLGLRPELKQALVYHGLRQPNPVQSIIGICVRRRISAVIYGPHGMTRCSGVAIAAINVAMNHASKEPCKSLSVVIVTSTAELVRETFSLVQQNLVSREGCKPLNTFGVLAVPSPSKGLLELAETSFGILVCTPTSLARMLDNLRFNAKSPRLLVFDQGMSLASGSFNNEMERITAWMNSKPTSSIQHLTIIVLSQLLDLELDLHRELQKYYMSTFLASKGVSTVTFDANPLAFFSGRAVPMECRYPVEARYKAFVDNIANNHQSIICVDYSLERLGNLKRLAGKDGRKAEILDSRSPSAAKLTMDRFRAGVFNLLLTTFADVEGIKCVHANAVAIFASPSRSSQFKLGVFKRRVDFLRDAVEAVRQHGEKARVYIFYAAGTDMEIKRAVAQILTEMGSPVPDRLKQNLRGSYNDTRACGY